MIIDSRSRQLGKRNIVYGAPGKVGRDLKAKEAKTMAKKGNGKVGTEKATKAKANFAEKAKAAAVKRGEERRKFFADHAKQIGEAFKAMDKPTSMGVGVKLKLNTRLVDYVTLRLGLRKSTDAGLIKWIETDEEAQAKPQATSAPKKRNNHAVQAGA